jgi:cob(I)alamin adenosyltransferase
MEEIYLAGGQQVWKDSVRVEAYGDVDELNSTIGVSGRLMRSWSEFIRLLIG